MMIEEFEDMFKEEEGHNKALQKLNCILEDHQLELGTSTPQMKGFEEKVVIRVDVKLSGNKQYSLDAQLDTGAMNSCEKHSAIPEYYWKPTNLQFIAVNKTLMTIRSMAPDFLIILNGIPTSVNLYNFDTCSDILLGQDFVRRHLPLVVEVSHICLNIQVRSIKIQSRDM